MFWTRSIYSRVNDVSTPRRNKSRPFRIETRVGLTPIADFKKIGRDCLIHV